MKSWTTSGKIEREGTVILEMEIYMTERQDARGKVYWSGSFNIPSGKNVEPGSYRLTLIDRQSCEIVVGPSSPNSLHVPREAHFEGTLSN